MPEQVVETPAAVATVAAEPAAPAVVEDSSRIEYLIGAAVIMCLGAIWKVYRKLAQKQKR
jgi:hypothetical protein